MPIEVLNSTISLCPSCLDRINAKVIEKDGKVIISKVCPEHGKFECLHAWDDPRLYRAFYEISKEKQTFIKDTTLDITSRCNMNCPFCFSTTKNKSYEPNFEEIIRRANLWKDGNILLYGGEPTLREDIFEIIKKIKNNGSDVHILTNGLNLSKEYVEELDNVGLDRVQLQFDSFDDQVNIELRNEKIVNRKLRAISNLKDTDIDLTLFVVLVKNYNDDELDKIISFTAKNSNKIVTLIFTPVSPEGSYNNFKAEHMTNDVIFERIEEKFDINKEDFITCTRFDVSLSNFLYEIFGIKRRSVAPCEALCYILVKNHRVLPLNRLIELDKFSEIFDNICRMDNRSRLIKPFSFLFKCIEKRVKISPSSIGFLFTSLLSIFISKIFGKAVKKNFTNTFGLIINPSQDRYNIDYNFIKKCNLYSDCDNDEFTTFCEKNIFSTGYKPLELLDKNKILNHM